PRRLRTARLCPTPMAPKREGEKHHPKVRPGGAAGARADPPAPRGAPRAAPRAPCGDQLAAPRAGDRLAEEALADDLLVDRLLADVALPLQAVGGQAAAAPVDLVVRMHPRPHHRPAV